MENGHLSMGLFLMEIDHIQDSPWDIYGYYIYFLVYQHRIFLWLNSMIKMDVYGRYNSSIHGACKPTHITGRHHVGSLAKKNGLLKKMNDKIMDYPTRRWNCLTMMNQIHHECP